MKRGDFGFFEAFKLLGQANEWVDELSPINLRECLYLETNDKEDSCLRSQECLYGLSILDLNNSDPKKFRELLQNH